MTDGRFSGGTYGLVVGHIAPEAQVGGPIAYLRTGDMVTVDQDTKEITMHVPDEELAKRKAETELPPLYSRGVLGKYAHIVSSASRGAVTDFLCDVIFMILSFRVLCELVMSIHCLLNKKPIGNVQSVLVLFSAPR